MDRFSETLQYTSRRDRDEDGFPDEPELECECRFSGDEADASECELHGSIIRQYVESLVIEPPYERRDPNACINTGHHFDRRWDDPEYRREPSTADLMHRLEDLLRAKRLKGAA